MESKEIIRSTKYFLKKYREIFAIIALAIICYILYFFAVGDYNFLGNNESAYFFMSKNMFVTGNYQTPNIDANLVLSNNPLLLWLQAISYGIFKNFSMFSTRIPVALCATIGVFLVYFSGKKISSKKYGIISAIILATSFIYILFARSAATQILTALCLTLSVFSGLYSLFCTEQKRKYFWWLTYTFAGAAMLSGGIFTLVVPLITVCTAYILTGKYKELFKPLYLIPGIVILLFITLPWFLMMYKQLGFAFFKGYFQSPVLYNTTIFDKFTNIESIKYLASILLLGFMPWIFSFVSQIVLYCTTSLKNTKYYFEKFNDNQPLSQFITLNIIYLVVVLAMFAITGLKDSTYIVACVFPTAFILGKFWFDYIYKDENNRAANISTLVFNFVLMVLGAIILISAQYIGFVRGINIFPLAVSAICLILAEIIANSFAIFKDRKLLHFLSIASFIIISTMFFVVQIMNFLSSN